VRVIRTRCHGIASVATIGFDLSDVAQLASKMEYRPTLEQRYLSSANGHYYHPFYRLGSQYETRPIPGKEHPRTVNLGGIERHFLDVNGCLLHSVLK
jgi:hypothetical protein